MKEYGKIIDFNGSGGYILSSDGTKYILNKNNITYENPKVGDFVYFNVEIFKTVEIEEKIATFVKKIERV